MQESACRITKKNGEVVEFGLSIEGVEEVADEIIEQTLQRMLPQVRAAIQNGSSVQFSGGPVGLDQPLASLRLRVLPANGRPGYAQKRKIVIPYPDS